MSAEALFGRDKYPYEDLQRYVPRVFTYMKRVYFNRTRAQIIAALSRINDVRLVREIEAEWIRDCYGQQAVHAAERRITQLTAPAP